MGRKVGIIPARFASSRFPGKPLAPIKGKSLIQRTFESASKADLDAVVVATDDERIAAHVRDFGGEVVMTSPIHSTGTDRVAEALWEIEADIVVNIQGDWPCIEAEVINRVAALAKEAPMGSAVVPIEDPSDPTLVKAVMDRKGNALYFSRAPVPYGGPWYGHLGIYSYQKEFLLQFPKMPKTPLSEIEKLEQLRAIEHGFPIRLVVVDRFSPSVDRPEDIEKVEEYLCQSSSL